MSHRVPVLNLEHLAEPATGLERSDDAVTHLRAGERVLGAIQRVGALQQPPLFVGTHATIALGLDLRFDFDAEPMER